MALHRVHEQWVTLDGEGPLWSQLYRALKQAVLSGALPPGSRVPSTRTLAGQVGVSRSTVVPVFDQLLAEGYFVSRHGSGTFVAEGMARLPAEERRPRAAKRRPARLSAHGARLASDALAYPYDAFAGAPPARHELLYGVAEEAAFPRAEWRRLIGSRLERASARTLSYSPPEGVEELREAIAGYLARSRGVRCTADRVLIVTGAQQALQLVAQVLLDPGDPVLIEEPHYLGARTAFLAAGARLVTAPVDGEGIDLGAAAPRALDRCRSRT